MTTQRQLPLTAYQVHELKGFHWRAFRMAWRLAEWHMGAMCGDTLEAIAGGVAALLTCRKAGRMVGMNRETARSIRRRNLESVFTS